MSYRTCDHLKENGVYCDSPALRGRNYRYFHLNVRGRRLQAAKARRRGESGPIQLPVLDDMHAVQMALMEVLDALAQGRIDHNSAGLMLYALQTASANLNGTPGWKGCREPVEEDEPLRALEFRGFEEHYGLPEGIDLEAAPEVALENAEQNQDAPQKVKKLRRGARVPFPEDVEDTQPTNPYEMDDASAVEWFFDRLGIKPPESEQEEEDGGWSPPRKLPQSAAVAESAGELEEMA